MPCYKLHYFNGRGFGETARIMFKLKGVEFEDKRYGGPTWDEFKPKTPNGQMPVLEVDGTMYSQSNAINWYVAEKLGLAGETPEDRVLINILIGNQQDLMKKYPFGDVDDKEAKLAKVFDEFVPEFLEKIEKDLVKRNTKSGHFLEDVTLADVTVLNFHTFYTAKDNRPNGFDKFPKLQQLVNKISEISNVKTWLKERPETPF